MKIIDDYFNKHESRWENIAGFCTDGAPGMLGSHSGLLTIVKEKNSSTMATSLVLVSFTVKH